MNACVENIERGKHPLKLVSTYSKLTCTDLELECLMYIKIFSLLKDLHQDKNLLAEAFHHYSLILGTINRFVVHQIHQNGFLQFQKITHNDLRSISEENYEKRFFQLMGNDDKKSNFLTIEGRFAPKMTPQELDALIGKIRPGWHSFKEQNKNTELKLICHFIKDKDSYDEFFRHEKLRNKLWTQANAILSLKNSIWMEYPDTDKKDLFRKFVGIDAAASEFDAPPEVFSPVFREIRKKSSIDKNHSEFDHFTFHSGEDFFHIVTGLRAIYETIEFLDFNDGDRIGHATALGISPELWKKRIGESIYISQGEWLDNLVFILHLLNIQPSALYNDINEEIRKYYQKIYSEPLSFSLHSLKSAWLNRKWDPEILFSDTFSEAEKIRCGCAEEWHAIQEQKIDKEVKQLIRKYHVCKKEYDKKILINHDIIDVELIEQIQQNLLKLINEKGIIIETLPTSNVRIGIYNYHKEHHLKRWIDEKIITNSPQIVVGSDDTGIFATNIYNEYSHIYLMYNENQNEIIKMLIDNGNKYLF